MKLVNHKDVTLEKVEVEGAKNTQIRWLVSDKDGAENFALRMFEVAPGGFTPYHTHNWEHEIFVVEGIGKLITVDDEKPFKAGDTMFINPNMYHQFRNAGDETLKFLCIIPIAPKEEQPKKVKKNINPFASGTANNC